MNRLLNLLFLPAVLLSALMLPACQSVDEEICGPEEVTAQLVGDENYRSIDEAIAIAENTAARLFPKNESRSAVRHASKSNVKVIKSDKGRSGEEEALIYAVNFDNNEGFALISRPRNVCDVLAVVPEGSFDEEEADNTPGVSLFMDCAKSYISLGIDSLNIPVPVHYPGMELGPCRIDTLMYYHLEPQVANIWGQKGFIGEFCPNKIVGCGPLAVATISVFQNFQAGSNTTLTYTFPERDINQEKINWTELCRHKREAWVVVDKGYQPEICYCEDKAAAHKTLARLCRQIGHDVDADYSSPIVTNIDKSVVPWLLRKYTPTKYTITGPRTFNCNEVSRFIDNGLLLVYGFDKIKGGHAWIADGYDILHTYEVYATASATGEYERHYRYFDRVMTYMHWGWDGDYDGFYSGNVFTPGSYNFDTEVEYVASSTHVVNN